MSQTPLPNVTVSPRAHSEIKLALAEEAATSALRVTSAGAQLGLELAPPEEGDVVLRVGDLVVAMSKGVARRADGLAIDFVDGPTGTGFKLETAGERVAVTGARPAELRRALVGRDAVMLIDVRPAREREITGIPQARSLEAEGESSLLGAPRSTPFVFLGHHSREGRDVARRFVERGFTNVKYVVGGIDAWATVDATVRRYARAPG
ncbi:MAG: hypothetical protein IT374_17915 [Polyangiaceae bacterium]|nr:hypothetical protein [Polyangiaceae bacterium]